MGVCINYFVYIPGGKLPVPGRSRYGMIRSGDRGLGNQSPKARKRTKNFLYVNDQLFCNTS